jgi:hypothetical protein
MPLIVARSFCSFARTASSARSLSSMSIFCPYRLMTFPDDSSFTANARNKNDLFVEKEELTPVLALTYCRVREDSQRKCVKACLQSLFWPSVSDCAGFAGVPVGTAQVNLTFNCDCRHGERLAAYAHSTRNPRTIALWAAAEHMLKKRYRSALAIAFTEGLAVNERGCTRHLLLAGDLRLDWHDLQHPFCRR